jgi:hypothetical protein
MFLNIKVLKFRIRKGTDGKITIKFERDQNCQGSDQILIQKDQIKILEEYK